MRRPEADASLLRFMKLWSQFFVPTLKESPADAEIASHKLLVRAGLVDELVVYVAPTLLGPDARGLLQLPPLAQLDQRQRWHYTDVASIGEDLRLTLRPR